MVEQVKRDAINRLVDRTFDAANRAQRTRICLPV
jgi:hypothetical protein